MKEAVINTKFPQSNVSLVERIRLAAQEHRNAAVLAAHRALTGSSISGQPEVGKVEFLQHLQAEATLLDIVSLLVGVS